MSEFRIVPLASEDIDLLVLHRRKMWEAIRPYSSTELLEADSVYRVWLTEMLRQGRFFGFKALAGDGAVVGSGCVWLRDVAPRPGFPNRQLPYLLSMFTEPEMRGQGIATSIVRAAMEWCRKRGFPRIELHSSEMGKKVYEELGFERTREMRANLEK